MPDNKDTTTISNASTTLTSVRTIMEALILAGLLYIMSNINQQGKDLVQLKTSSDYIAKSVDKIPNMEFRLTTVEITANNNSKRLTDLETLQKAK